MYYITSSLVDEDYITSNLELNKTSAFENEVYSKRCIKRAAVEYP